MGAGCTMHAPLLRAGHVVLARSDLRFVLARPSVRQVCTLAVHTLPTGSYLRSSSGTLGGPATLDADVAAWFKAWVQQEAELVHGSPSVHPVSYSKAAIARLLLLLLHQLTGLGSRTSRRRAGSAPALAHIAPALSAVAAWRSCALAGRVLRVACTMSGAEHSQGSQIGGNPGTLKCGAPQQVWAFLPGLSVLAAKFKSMVRVYGDAHTR